MVAFSRNVFCDIEYTAGKSNSKQTSEQLSYRAFIEGILYWSIYNGRCQNLSKYDISFTKRVRYGSSLKTFK